MSFDGSRTMLTRHVAGMREPDPREAKQAARASYYRSGGDIVLINKKWLKNWTDRKQLDVLAEQALGVKGVE